jgi:hypothetical protein
MLGASGGRNVMRHAVSSFSLAALGAVAPNNAPAVPGFVRAAILGILERQRGTDHQIALTAAVVAHHGRRGSGSSPGVAFAGLSGAQIKSVYSDTVLI